MYAILLIAVCIATVGALPVAPIDTVLSLYPTANLTGWQPCEQILTSSMQTRDLPRLQAKCSGPSVMIAMVQNGFTNTLILAAGSSPANVFGNVTSGDITWYNYPTHYGFVNGSATPPANCLLATGQGLCRNNGFVGAYSPTTGYVSSIDFAIVFFHAPCGNLSAGDPCLDSRGLCAQNNTCQASGLCSNGTTIPVPAPLPCEQSVTCDPAFGNFSVVYAANGTICNTTTDLCAVQQQCSLNHTCETVSTKFCFSSDPCILDGVCNATTGGCDYPNFANSTTGCTDLSMCTTGDMCDMGVCVGTIVPPENITCKIATTCAPENGSYTYINAPDGVSCIPETPCTNTTLLGNAYTCQTGVCTPTSYTDCSLITVPPCFVTGFCNATSTSCTTAPAPIGAPCDDLNPCTVGTTCGFNETCAFGTAADIGPPPSLPPCVLPVRYMVDLFTCVWNTTMASDNITCSLPNATCTENPTCQSGLCVGTPKLCPGDQCNAPTTCSLTTGCINPLDPTGTLNIPCSKQCFDNSVCGSAGFCLGVTYNASQPGCLFGGACEMEWLLSALDFN